MSDNKVKTMTEASKEYEKAEMFEDSSGVYAYVEGVKIYSYSGQIWRTGEGGYLDMTEKALKEWLSK